MDSLQGIPVEYKLDAFNMPRTGTTLCHPKIGYVNAMLLFRSRHTSYQFTSGPLQWRQRILSSPKIPDTRNSHVRRHTLSSQPSQLLVTQFRLLTHNLTHHESCSTRSKPNIPCCKIKLISKNTFRLSPSYFFILPLIPNYN